MAAPCNIDNVKHEDNVDNDKWQHPATSLVWLVERNRQTVVCRLLTILCRWLLQLVKLTLNYRYQASQVAAPCNKDCNDSTQLRRSSKTWSTARHHWYVSSLQDSWVSCPATSCSFICYSVECVFVDYCVRIYVCLSERHDDDYSVHQDCDTST